MREAKAFGPRPAQVAAAPGLPAWSPAEGLDCLTLNLWTPDEGGSGLPVMVWIYGGGYQTGSADLADYDGALLADAHAGTTFAYELTWSPTELGACHALDVPLTFGSLDGTLAGWVIRGAPEAEALSLQFRTAWTRFAMTGDPGWPAYEPVAATTHLFDVEPSDVGDPEAVSRALWSERGFSVFEP